LKNTNLGHVEKKGKTLSSISKRERKCDKTRAFVGEVAKGTVEAFRRNLRPSSGKERRVETLEKGFEVEHVGRVEGGGERSAKKEGKISRCKGVRRKESVLLEKRVP